MIAFRRVAVLAAFCAAVAVSGCAAGGPGFVAGPPIPVDGQTLLDGYVLAHGFAAGRVLSRDVDRRTVLEIVTLDRAALLALSVSAADPTSTEAAGRARDAIERLADYAASGIGGGVS